MRGGTGNDYVQGTDGNDTVYGGDGDDKVRGAGDADVLYGGKGNDSIEAKSGDGVHCGPGIDRVYLGSSSTADAGCERVVPAP